MLADRPRGDAENSGQAPGEEADWRVEALSHLCSPFDSTHFSLPARTPTHGHVFCLLWSLQYLEHLLTHFVFAE